MMKWWRSLLSVGLALVAAVVLHAAVLVAVLVGMWWYGVAEVGGVRPRGVAAKAHREAERENEQPERREEDAVRLGREDVPEVLTVAWIGHEDWRALQARRSRTQQPALQREADPVARAAVVEDPTPLERVTREAVDARDAARPRRVEVALTTPVPRPGQAAPRPAAEGNLQPPPIAMLTPGTGTAPLPPIPPPQPASPSAPPSLSSPPTASPSQPAAPPERDTRPTAAPRDDSESPPTRVDLDVKAVKPGGVIVGRGLKMIVARPRFSAVTLSSTMPRNPLALITFNADGTVRAVELKESSGAANVDGPVVASLYRWRAEGRRLSEIDGPFVIEMRILLVEE